MEITPDKKKLLALVEQAAEGTIALPRFQRNFVWSRDDIGDLLASVLKGYFIGSFLLLEMDASDSPFDYQPIVGSRKDPSSIRPNRLILDGQQRLTSLHYVFTAPRINLKWTKYPYRFFVDLNKVRTGDLDAALFSDREPSCAPYLDRETQFRNLIVPFTELPSWEKWLNAYEKWLIERDKDRYFEDYFPNVKPCWNAVMDTLRQFVVPTIEIPKVASGDSERIAEVCAIFEKMNSTGVSLSVYDLLTARLYRYGIDLHACWIRACDRYDMLAQFAGKDQDPDPYGLYLLRTMALMRGQEVKSKSLINISPDHFEEDWHRAAECVDRALRRIASTNADGFGAFEEKWLPYSTMVPVLAALLSRIEECRLGARAFVGLKAWYWSSVFLERYAGAVESTSAADYREIVEWFTNPGRLPTAFRAVRVNILDNPNYTLQNAARLNSVVKGIMNLIAIRGAKDFQDDDSIEFHVLDAHHVFPLAHLGKAHPELDWTHLNNVVNKTLISAQTNRRIGGRPPSEYTGALIPPVRAAEILATHFIEGEALDAMQADDYARFLQAREALLLSQVRRAVSYE